MRNGKKSGPAAQLATPAQPILRLFQRKFSALKRGKAADGDPAISWAVAAAGLALRAAGPADARKKRRRPRRPRRRSFRRSSRAMPALDAFYFYDRSGTPVWLRDDAGRQAAARVAEILDRAPIDGLAEGPALAAIGANAAIAGGTLGDDAADLARLAQICPRAESAGRPASHYGDPALMPGPPTAKEALSDAARRALDRRRRSTRSRPSIRSIRRFATSRDRAAQSADPRVRATLDRLRLLPGDRPRDPGRRRQRRAVDARERPAGRTA